MSVTGHGPVISPFRIDILDASGNILGDGPLINVSRLETTDSLDKIGSAVFEVPASDPRTAYIQAGRQFDIYDAEDGVHMRFLGRYSYKSRKISDKNGVGLLAISCYDALRELSKSTVAFRRTYNNVAVETVIADLISDVSGWSTSIDSGIGNTTVSFEGESPFSAIDVLRDRWGQHFRLQQTSPALRIFEFGAFGDDSGVRICDMRGQEQAQIAMKPEVAIVESIRLVDEADEIFNSIVALGAGHGVSQLTMETATLGSYDLDEGINDDGSSFWYIQDDTSVTNYGEIWKVLTFPNIRPITNSAANIVNAANALKLTAEAYLARHTAPRVTYDVVVRGLRTDIQVGDTVRLQYRGVVEGYSYIDVDDDFYVMDIMRSRSVNGDRFATLTISTLAERRTSDTDIVLDVVRDINALKVHVPLTLAYAPVGPYAKRMDSSNEAEFTVRIGEEVNRLNYAILRFKTSPLRASATAAASGGGATSSANGAHRHIVAFNCANQGAIWSGGAWQFDNTFYLGKYTIIVEEDGTDLDIVEIPSWQADAGKEWYTYDEANDHTHTVTAHTHDLTYGLYEDDQYPTELSLSINGIDRTTELGGTWDDAGEGIEVEIDITDFLVNAVGGLQQNHSIIFSCDSGQGEIEAEVDMLVTIQAIAVS